MSRRLIRSSEQRALARRDVGVDRVADQRVDEVERVPVEEDLAAGQHVEGGSRRPPPSAATGRPPLTRSAIGPSTATARATVVTVALGMRRRRSVTSEVIARDPTARTVSTWAASGGTPWSASARSSWRRSSGLPEVIRWQVATNVSAPRPSRSVTRAAVPCSVSGAGAAPTADSSRRRARPAGRRPRCVLTGAHRQHDQHGKSLEAPDQVGEELQRRLVAPLDVVDAQHERGVLGELGRQLAEPAEYGEPLVAAYDVVDAGVEQLPDHPELEALLQRAAPRGPHRYAGC